MNDGSTNIELYEPLQKYVAENFHGVAKVLNLKNRMGLIVARMEGAKTATGEVLVFLDAHIEANVNWLPPLLGYYLNFMPSKLFLIFILFKSQSR